MPTRTGRTRDGPIVVAGRHQGTFGGANFADRLLGLCAGPATEFATLLVIPALYLGTEVTRGESFVVAAIGFVLSTSFWTAVGGTISAWRAYRRRLVPR